MARTSFCALAFVLAGAAVGQLPPPQSPPLVGARSLALSPDGRRLAFCYQGDIWVVPSAGGKATPLTNHVEMDDNPVWSPDGQYVAFASNRSGNWDVYVVPADGGPTKRLTWQARSRVSAIRHRCSSSPVAIRSPATTSSTSCAPPRNEDCPSPYHHRVRRHSTKQISPA